MNDILGDDHGPCVAVFGYGDERGGDGSVGLRVARAVASWQLPGVRAMAMQQLTREHAAALATADHAFFVDAWETEGDAEPRLVALEPEPGVPPDARGDDPRALLALAEALYGRRPGAWRLLIPASHFACGANLSPATSRGMLVALRLLRDLMPTLAKCERCTRVV